MIEKYGKEGKGRRGLEEKVKRGNKIRRYGKAGKNGKRIEDENEKEKKQNRL